MRRVMVMIAVLGLALAGCTSRPSTPPPPVNVTVFLTMEATEQDKHAVETAIRALPGVMDVTFETREEAYQKFKEQFKDHPDLVNSARPEAMPESWRFRIAGRAAADKAIAQLKPMP